MTLVNDKSNRIRANIEDGNRLGPLDTALGRGVGIYAPELFQTQPSSSPIPALPRPDSDGLVMK
ncbi:hypothetical protein D3C87_1776630 [compost metagenome]